MSKYYTPSIEEFHVGFECETEHTNNNGVKFGWEKTTLQRPFASFNTMEIRVKYLDLEDIESFGFHKKAGWEFVMPGPVQNYTLHYFEDYRHNHPIHVFIGESMVFNGKIKNKSELKVLLNQLNISR